MSGNFPLWSKTAGNNSTADATINWAEGQSASSVNDSARNLMAALASWRDDSSGLLVSAGGPVAFTVTTNQGLPATPQDGQYIRVSFGVANGAAATLQADGGNAYALQSAPGSALAAGALGAGAHYGLRFNLAQPSWILADFYNVPLGANAVATVNIQDDAVTYAKIQNETTNTFLGNVSGAPASPEELTFGSGFAISGTTVNVGASPTGAFANKIITVASTTTVNVTADWVVVSDGTSATRVAINSTGANVLNLGTAGGLNKLDTGVIAINTWYAIYAIALPGGGTPGVIASTSFTSPNLAWGAYTLFGYMGAVQTLGSGATLYGTKQIGNRATYVVGLAGTTASVMAVVGANGSTYSLTSPTLVSVSLTRFVPQNAAVARLAPDANYKGGGPFSVLIAPSQAYSGANNGPSGSNGMVYTYVGDQTILAAGSAIFTGAVDLVLEALSFSYAGAGGGTGSAVAVQGWSDQ